mmetsp:Transcript_59225/g.132847  ORF Transcript_59225/g.132847 Transcript_59225/m.132847 type:complete len:276 (+) Transcript_59225:111-938(+)
MIRHPLRDSNNDGGSSSEKLKNRALDLKDQVRSAISGISCCSSKSAVNIIDPMAPRPKYSQLPDPDGVAGRMGNPTFAEGWPASGATTTQVPDGMSWPSTQPPAAELSQPSFSEKAQSSGSKASRREAAAAAARVPAATDGFGLVAPPRGASRRAQLAALGATEVTRFCRGAAAAAAAGDGMDGDEDSECAICSEPLGVGDTMWRLPCGHAQWHEACVHQWLSRNGTCPMCRVPVDIPRGNQPPPKEEPEEDLKGKKGKAGKEPSAEKPPKSMKP